MPRQRQHIPLRVLLNNRFVGLLLKTPGGAITFRYAPDWLAFEPAIPVSLSLPLREDAYRGAPVAAVFDNLLPDSDGLRRKIATGVKAEGTDAYSLLSVIGRDCVGAMQFIPEDDPAVRDTPDATRIAGRVVGEEEIEHTLKNLTQAPLGLGQEREFRISVAGAQEKTALLFHEGKWWKPAGTTPTTHLFKPQIGTLSNGLDLSASVENEWYCLRLMAAFGLPVNHAEIRTFGQTKTLVVERFDRQWTAGGRLLRLPQEDCCQALSVPPGRKYQNDGGPGMVDILNLLKGADNPAEDQKQLLKAQVIYWLIGATDGHAKNFSLFLGPQGRFKLTPFYDVLTAQPSQEARKIDRRDMKLAMCAGKGHYQLDYILGRHFVQTAERAGLPTALAQEVLDEVAATATEALDAVERELPADFPQEIPGSVRRSVLDRLANI